MVEQRDESTRGPRRIPLLSLAARARWDWESAGLGVGLQVVLDQIVDLADAAVVVVAVGDDKGDGVEGAGRGFQTGRVDRVGYTENRDRVGYIEVRDRIDCHEDGRRIGGDWREGGHTENVDRVGCIVEKSDHIVGNVG